MSLIILSTSKTAQGGGPVYSDDVFATTLYTGTGAARSVVTGVDLLGKGGLAWFKPRNSAKDNLLFDTNRGANRMRLSSNLTVGDINNPLFGTHDLKAFTATGFDIGTPYTEAMNVNGQTQVVWSFAKAPKFFDIVKYTGNGVIGRQITHALGLAPGMIVVKNVSIAGQWWVYHRELGATKYLQMNGTSPAGTSGAIWNNNDPSSETFTVDGVGGYEGVNAPGNDYIAYLWAHDTSADGIVQCGIATGGGTVNLGWQPQFVLLKSAATSNWAMFDVARGLATAVGGASAGLLPNTSDTEFSVSTWISTTSAGMTLGSALNGANWIYMAIRAPNKPVDLSTYAKFETWVNAQNAQNATGTSNISPLGSNLTYRVTNNAQNSGSMWGSVHGTYAYSSSALSRALQHAYPSYAAYIAGSGQKALVVMKSDGNRLFFTGVSRNSYASFYSDEEDDLPAWLMTTFIYWDNALGKAMWRNPSLGDTGTGIPTDFNGIL